MAETQYSTDSLRQGLYEDWDSKLEKDLLDHSVPANKSFTESSLILDNGTLYGSSRGLSKRRVISSLEDSDSNIKEDNREYISHVNELLKRNGFQTIKSSSHTSFLKLIERLIETIEEIRFGVSFSSIDDVFHKAFNRGLDRNSKGDKAIAELITVYEVQRKNFEREIEKLNRELQNKRKIMSQIEENMRQGYHKALSDMQEKLNVLESRCSDLGIDRKGESEGYGENQGIIEEVCRILSIKQPGHIVPAVVKLEKVLRAVPQLEKFIKEVFQIVSLDEKSGKLSMELVIPTLKQCFKELRELRNKRKNPDRMQTSFQQEVIEHFKHLFEIDKEEDIIETMDQVFLFVHELRSFLKSIRLALNLDEGVTVNGILVRVKQIIENF